MTFGFTKKQTAHDQKIRLLIERHWDNFEQQVYHELGHLEAQYVYWRKWGRIATSFAVGDFIFFGVLSAGDGEFAELLLGNSSFFGIVLLVVAIVSLPFALWAIHKWSKINKAFNKQLNPLVFKKAFSVLGFTAAHSTIEDLGSKEGLKAVLDHSELITEPHNRVMADDVVYSEYAGRQLFLAEFDIKHVTGSGKNRREKKIFHGIFISYDLPKTLEAKTFVSTEGDKKGFAHQSIWARLFGKKDVVRETMLEWNEFEDKLHVATTNETEARYILTTDLMQELYDWWAERPGNIRISFIANRMYVLFPDKDVKLGYSTVSLKRKDLEDYILTIARPMWHVAQLLDDIERRFG